MYIIVGLGNPGTQYSNTHHNAGFMAIDSIAASHGVKIDRLKFRSIVAEATIGSLRVLLMKPQTFMNLSGLTVQEALSWYKVKPEEMLLIVDDIDLPFGRST